MLKHATEHIQTRQQSFKRRIKFTLSIIAFLSIGIISFEIIQMKEYYIGQGVIFDKLVLDYGGLKNS